MQEARHFRPVAHQLCKTSLNGLEDFDNCMSGVDLEGAVLRVGDRDLFGSRIGTDSENFQEIRHTRLRCTIESNLGVRVRHCPLELLDDRVRIVLEIDDPSIRIARFRHLRGRILEIRDLGPRAWSDDLGENESVSKTTVESNGDVSGDFDVLPLIFSDGNLLGVVEQDVRSLKGRVGEQSCGHEIGFSFCGLVLELSHAAQFTEGDRALHEPGQL